MGHTPGPWRVKRESRIELEICSGAFIVAVASRGFHNDFEKDEQEMIANANLIAAAPEMLEELKVVYESYSLPNEYRHRLGLLIAKATGVTPTQGATP